MDFALFMLLDDCGVGSLAEMMVKDEAVEMWVSELMKDRLVQHGGISQRDTRIYRGINKKAR